MIRRPWSHTDTKTRKRMAGRRTLSRLGTEGFDEAVKKAAKSIPKGVARGLTPKKAGRPSKYSDELADRICEEMINGRDLLAICAGAEFPDRVTVYRWMNKHPDFATHIARAREALGDHAAFLVQDVADKCTPETANADRVKLVAYQWRAARLAPKRYSERKVNELVGADGGPIKTEATVVDASGMDADERAALRAVLKAAKKEKGA